MAIIHKYKENREGNFQHPPENWFFTIIQQYEVNRKKIILVLAFVLRDGKTFDTGVISRLLHLFFQIHFPVGLKHLFWVFERNVKSLSISIQDLYSSIKGNTVLSCKIDKHVKARVSKDSSPYACGTQDLPVSKRMAKTSLLKHQAPQISNNFQCIFEHKMAIWVSSQERFLETIKKGW